MGILDALFPLDADGYHVPPTDVDGFLSDDLIFTWESQVTQYPEKGTHGVDYFKGVVDDERHVDCLLYRDAHGEVVGILNYYGFDFPPHERKGYFNIWVRPDRQRQGIGTALLTEALSRWPIDLGAQRYTRAGKALADSFVTLTLRIENCYELYENEVTTPTITVPMPPRSGDDDDMDEWAQDHIFEATGVGDGGHEDGNSWYDVEVTASSRPDVIPVGESWEFGY